MEPDFFLLSAGFSSGFFREVPRMVASLETMPDTEELERGVISFSMRPASRYGYRSFYKPAIYPGANNCTDHRVQPGQSPPPVRTPMVFVMSFLVTARFLVRLTQNNARFEMRPDAAFSVHFCHLI